MIKLTEQLKEVQVPNGKETLSLFVKQVGYLQAQPILKKIQDDKYHGLAELVAECVTDKEGNRFTTDEVHRLTSEVAKPLIAAVLEVNGLTAQEEQTQKN